jgi:hypothetical protein
LAAGSKGEIMIIKLSPQRSDATLRVTKAGDTLVINDISYGFSVVPEGATLPSSAVDCELITGDITRTDGILNVTLVLPHGANPSQSVAFPADLIDPPDGPLVLPGGAA